MPAMMYLTLVPLEFKRVAQFKYTVKSAANIVKVDYKSPKPSSYVSTLLVQMSQ